MKPYLVIALICVPLAFIAHYDPVVLFVALPLAAVAVLELAGE